MEGRSNIDDVIQMLLCAAFVVIVVFVRPMIKDYLQERKNRRNGKL